MTKTVVLFQREVFVILRIRKVWCRRSDESVKRAKCCTVTTCCKIKPFRRSHAMRIKRIKRITVMLMDAVRTRTLDDFFRRGAESHFVES